MRVVGIIDIRTYITSGGGLGGGLGGHGGVLYFGIPVIHRHTRKNRLYFVIIQHSDYSFEHPC